MSPTAHCNVQRTCTGAYQHHHAMLHAPQARMLSKHCWFSHSFKSIRRTSPHSATQHRQVQQPSEACEIFCLGLLMTLLLTVQADQRMCSSSPAMLDRELPQSKQPGLVLEPGPAGTWDGSAIGNPVVSAPKPCTCADFSQNLGGTGSRTDDILIAIMCQLHESVVPVTPSAALNW